VSVAFCTHRRFVEHQTAKEHPERPDRLRAITSALAAASLLDSAEPFAPLPIDFGTLPISDEQLIRLAEPAMVEERWLATEHTPAHIEAVRAACEIGGLLDEGDTPVCPASFDVAKLAVGAVLSCCDAVMRGDAQRAFAAVRPPGHHAEPNRAMGFCLFANVAIAARYLQQAHGVARVAIVDFDVHHGNGTQAAFLEDDSVLFISLHQSPNTCYPGTGYERERGVGGGLGFTLNIPFPPGVGDAEYQSAIELKVAPALEDFAPEFLLLSAGFDAHRDDPLAQINLTEQGFGQLTRSLVAAADHLCAGRIVSVLEGGYNLRALGRCVVHHLIGLT
jgi:acetoin utilization deacetylase AcuC-like enzyme